jgi:predicted neutral ceramidase superfamily lipid hydrolase
LFFFFLSLVIDVGLWFLILPKNSVIFPELGRRNRIYLFSFVTGFTLFLLMAFVYPLIWGLVDYLIMVKFFVNQVFSFFIVSSPSVLKEPWRLLSVYQGLNGLFLYSTGFITGCTDAVDRIFWVVGLRYFYLLPITEQVSRFKFLRVPIATVPAIYLVELFRLANSPAYYIVSTVIFCVVIPVLIFEAMVLGTSATFKIGGKKIRVSQFDIIRKLITWDILQDDSQRENLSFTDFSQKIRVGNGVVAFKDVETEDCSLIVVPSLHPGPLLSFCGSLLSYKISEKLKDDYRLVMTPHSPSTHDFNPASASEIFKIVDAVRIILKYEKEFYEFASPVFVEESGKYGGKLRVFCQAFSNGGSQKVLILCDLPNENNGDISYGVGKYLTEIAKSVGAEDAIIIDKHFYPHKEERPLYMEDPLTEDLKELVKRAVKKALNSEKEKILFAGSKLTRKEIELEHKQLAEQIGRDGITLYILNLENRAEKSAYILIDANTVEPELGRKILKLFLDHGFKENNVLIMTSDTHQDLLFLKPFGSNKNIHEPLIRVLKKLLKVTVSLIRAVSEVNVWGLLNGERFFTLFLRAFPKSLASLLIYWIIALILSLLIL